MRFEIFTDADGQTRFRLRAANNEILMSSEAYKHETSARHAIELIKNSKDAPIIDLRRDKKT